ncbi:EpsG family protein [Alphaproteobacteria bacterium]|nr:EpsG family protein [Alphaproteobacteria bacterium]
MTYLITSPYFWFFYFFVFLAIVEFVKSNKFVTRIPFFIGLIFLVLLIGLRDGSPDQATYINIWSQMPSLSEFWISEKDYEQLKLQHPINLPNDTINTIFSDRPYFKNIYLFEGNYETLSMGFSFLISALKSLGFHNPIALFMFVGMTVVSASAIFCMRFSPLPILSFCLFFSWFLYPSFGAIRHALAMGMFMIFLIFWLNRRFIVASIATILGSSFHIVLLPIVLLLPIWEKMATRRFCVLLFLLSLAVATLFGGFFHKFFQIYGDYLPVLIRYKYEAYELALKTSGQADFLSNPLVSGVLLKQCFILVSCFVFYGSATNKYLCFKALTFWYAVGVSSYLFFLDFSILSSRISNILTVVEVALIPMLLCSVDFKRYNRVVRFAGVLAVLALCWAQLLSIYGNELREYEFIGFRSVL